MRRLATHSSRYDDQRKGSPLQHRPKDHAVSAESIPAKLSSCLRSTRTADPSNCNAERVRHNLQALCDEQHRRYSQLHNYPYGVAERAEPLLANTHPSFGDNPNDRRSDL